jgi:hypothetical protein
MGVGKRGKGEKGEKKGKEGGADKKCESNEDEAEHSMMNEVLSIEREKIEISTLGDSMKLTASEMIYVY